MNAGENSQRSSAAHNVCVNGTRNLRVAHGGVLLAALWENGIDIPSVCGGKGLCGRCKLKVLSDVGPLNEAEKRRLSPEEQRSHMRLSCQVRVDGDLDIEVPEDLLGLRRYETRVESLHDLTYDVREVRLTLVEPEAISFRPGQYVQFTVPAYEKSADEVVRAYSIASSPSDTGALEFVIRRVPDGLCTTYVFDYLKEGDPLRVNGPYGEFVLRDTDAEIIFIAGSTGIAPIKSILHDMAEQGSRRKATFFFGALARRDLFYLDEMRAFEEKLPTFTFVPALSQPAQGDAWDGETGLITEVVDRHVPADSQAEAYLCGSPGMIDASIEVLKSKGITEDRIFFDKYA